MMVEKDDLRLSLSLSSADSRFPLQLSLMPSSSPAFLPNQKTHWSDLLASSERGGAGGLKGIDVNRTPAGERESEEEAGASSPNSTVSSVSGNKRGERDLPSLGHGSDEHEAERACSRSGISDEEDGEASRKKLRLSKDQSAILEESFKEHNTLNPKQKLALAKQLNLRPRQVEVWFQNRRARTKLKQTEVDCEFLKRCCENLTEENRRLQKEVAELRALKLSPQFYMHMTPPTTLTMCPSCERVAVPNSNTSNSHLTNAASAAAATNAVQTQPPAAPPPPPPDHHHHLHQQQFHHSPRHFPMAAATPAPWAPIPLRAAFMDAPPQRS